jgi:hypothetical protein
MHDLDEFNMCSHNADAAVISHHCEVYLYFLLGGIMFYNSSGDYVEQHLIWLACELTAQTDEDISYNWRSAVLADTYRGLCDACRRLTSRGSILGCLLLLQMWSWEYLPTSRPWVKKAYYPIPISKDIPDTMRPTMGYRCMFARLCWMH